MEIYENILGNLTPSELDELAPASFDAKAPRGAVKRIEKAAVEKAGLGSSMSATERKSRSTKKRLKPLIIAAAAVVASAATLFTVNASMEGNLVRFFINGEEVEGEHRDYVDHDGYRHVTFEAVVPLELTNYAVIVDVDNPEEFVRVFTEDTDPEFLDSIRQYQAASIECGRKTWGLIDKACEWKGVDRKTINNMSVLDQIYDEAVAAGAIDPADRPTDPTPEDFGIFLTDSQELIWEFYWTDVNSNGVEMCHGNSGGYSGKFKYQKTPKGKNYRSSTGTKNRDYENNTKTLVLSYVFYVGKDYVKESGKEIEGSYRDYVDHDGYRNVSFDAILPVEAENYAVIFDSEAPNYEDAVRVLTDESDPEFFESLRQYHAEFERIGQERNALMDAGGDENDLPEYREAEEFGLISKDSEVCCWNIEFLEDGRKQGGCGAFGGKLKTTGTAEGRPPKYSKSENIDYDNGTKSVHLEVKYYMGLD